MELSCELSFFKGQVEILEYVKSLYGEDIFVIKRCEDKLIDYFELEYYPNFEFKNFKISSYSYELMVNKFDEIEFKNKKYEIYSKRSNEDKIVHFEMVKDIYGNNTGNFTGTLIINIPTIFFKDDELNKKFQKEVKNKLICFLKNTKYEIGKIKFLSPNKNLETIINFI